MLGAAPSLRIAVISTRGRNLSLIWQSAFLAKKDFSLYFEMTAFKAAINFEMTMLASIRVALLRRAVREPPLKNSDA
jgi:hypothetical protein